MKLNSLATRAAGTILLPLACVLQNPASAVAAEAQTPSAPPHLYRLGDNLVMNASFEQNWFNRSIADRRRFLLLQASDMGVGETDGHVDHWTVSRNFVWDTSVARSGSRSVRFDQDGQASQLVRFAGENNPNAGGNRYGKFMPMVQSLAAQVEKRPIVVGAWCRTESFASNAPPRLTVSVQCSARKEFEKPEQWGISQTVGESNLLRSAAYSAGSHDWEYREVRIEPGELSGVPFYLTVTLSAQGHGQVWFDDVSCVDSPSADMVNRLPNAGFEALDANGWAWDWKPPALWTWFRNTYYTFTGWSHADSPVFRGTAAVDRIVAYAGNGSLRLTALPGDNFAVESAPIDLSQNTIRPVEVRAMVKADNLRTLEIMGKDENGRWLRQGDFLGDDMQEPGTHYNMGTTGAGTYDWTCVRKFFSPEQPIKTLHLFLCVRGFDGRIVPDKNIVGTVWIDDLRVLELGIKRGEIPAKSVPAQPADAPPVYPFRVADIDLGSRLWGKNTARMTLEFRERNAVAVKKASLRLSLTGPDGQAREFRGGTRIVQAAGEGGSTGCAIAVVDYPVDSLCKGWKEQYKLSLYLESPGVKGQPPREEFRFGTPERILAAGLSGYYLYPDEKAEIRANLNVSPQTIAELSRCALAVQTAGREKTAAEICDFSLLQLPRAVSNLNLNTRNLVSVEVGSDGIAVHACADPVLDNVARFRLYAKAENGEKLLAESEGLPFGFLSHFPKPDFPDRIERSAVNDQGFVTLNGKAYFPVAWDTQTGEKRLDESVYSPFLAGYKSIDVTAIVYSNKAAPDAGVKAQLLARVNEVKDDPRFLSYRIGEGEMQLQDREWVARVEWCKTAIQWIREADPKHLIDGPVSWLIGHPRHDETMPRFVPFWDVVGVEASFESRVRVNEVAKPLMKGRKTAVIVGLEAYSSQPLNVLRWRGYRAVLDGAAGIGLCPSGMLKDRPDMVNYLRGLNAEFRALGPAILAGEPADRIQLRCDPELPPGEGVDTMERTSNGKRYLLAVRGKDGQASVRARFQFPPAVRCKEVKVLFEGRTLPASASGFDDEFGTPQTVHVYEME